MVSAASGPGIGFSTCKNAHHLCTDAESIYRHADIYIYIQIDMNITHSDT